MPYVNVKALNDAMDRSGKRLISPMHYAQATNITYDEATKVLLEYAKLGYVKKHNALVFTVLEFSIDD